MRQAGVIAAAGVIALTPGPDGMIDRLAEDHANARRLAEGLAQFEYLDVDLSRVQTNFVMFRVRRTRRAGRSAAPGSCRRSGIAAC